jgi:hypothetical protein
MTLLDPDSSLELIHKVQILQRPSHFVILPISMSDPGNSQRRLFEISANKIRLDNLIREIMQ